MQVFKSPSWMSTVGMLSCMPCGPGKQPALSCCWSAGRRWTKKRASRSSSSRAATGTPTAWGCSSTSWAPRTQRSRAARRIARRPARGRHAPHCSWKPFALGIRPPSTCSFRMGHASTRGSQPTSARRGPRWRWTTRPASGLPSSTSSGGSPASRRTSATTTPHGRSPRGTRRCALRCAPLCRGSCSRSRVTSTRPPRRTSVPRSCAASTSGRLTSNWWTTRV
mmetsp:Transcript_105930/g.299659  ORF Transcript_105930/g.299659 Transcript_105930/m.299659 type:complete len:223 (-) Transcript_105930:135-803(-)